MNIKNIEEKIIAKIAAEAKRLGDKIPYIPAEDGHYTDADSIFWWTNGFWGGILWQLYAATNDELFKNTAELGEKRLDKAFADFDGIDHDAGFLWMLTAGGDFKLTENSDSRRRILHAATLLAGRYNPELGIIRAWNNPWMGEYNTAGGAIIDTMMNLPLLFYASEITGDPRFAKIAANHADTMLEYMVREDGSVNHQIVFDISTHEYIANPGGQGYESGSSWSRGQAWAIYGFALAYGYTGNKKYLDTAKRAAAYFIANASLTDYIPLSDFRAPSEPVYYDTSAGAAAACGMLEIAKYAGEYEADMYRKNAERLIAAIDAGHCDYDPETDGIVNDSSVSYHCPKHHEKIIYADYFYIEAVLRLCGRGFKIW